MSNYPQQGVVKWLKFTKTFTDFSIAATTNDIEIYLAPAFAVVNSGYVRVTQEFIGGTTVANTIGAGTAGNQNRFCGGAPVNSFILSAGQSNNGSPIILSLSSTTSIRFYMSSTGDNIDQLTQGSVDVYLQISFME